MKNDDLGNAFRMFIIEDLALKAEKKGEDVIRLTLGKTDFQLQEGIKQKMIQAIYDDEKSNLVFPLGLPELRKELSKHYKITLGIDINEERIFIDSGTSSIFRNLLQAIIKDEGDEVLIPKPYYPLYKISAQLANAKIKYYSVNLDTLEIDVNLLEKQLTERTRCIILNSPGNPLGNIIKTDTLLKVLEKVPEGIYLIFDEIYENARFNGEPSITKLLLSGTRFQKVNVIITNSFSKAYRMYTKRIGWCILPPDKLTDHMTVVMHHTRLTVDPGVQYGALEALKYTTEIEDLNDAHKKRWDYTKLTLSRLKDVKLFESKGGFYCTLDCNGFIVHNNLGNCYNLAVDILQKVKVALVPGQDFGLPGTLRLSYTNKRYEEAIDRLFYYFNS